MIPTEKEILELAVEFKTVTIEDRGDSFGLDLRNGTVGCLVTIDKDKIDTLPERLEKCNNSIRYMGKDY